MPVIGEKTATFGCIGVQTCVGEKLDWKKGGERNIRHVVARTRCGGS